MTSGTQKKNDHPSRSWLRYTVINYYQPLKICRRKRGPQKSCRRQRRRHGNISSAVVEKLFDGLDSFDWPATWKNWWTGGRGTNLRNRSGPLSFFPPSPLVFFYTLKNWVVHKHRIWRIFAQVVRGRSCDDIKYTTHTFQHRQISKYINALFDE